MEIEIFPDKGSLARRAAEHFVELADRAFTEKGSFSVALSGGSTPQALYALLAKTGLDWRRVHLFWGDERCVPPDHPDSNYRMVCETLISQIEIPGENIRRIKGELPPKQAAQDYEKTLRSFFPEGDTFDLLLLGMGDDGHTASLFPASLALNARQHWTAVVEHNRPPPPLVDRISLTLPIINSARQIIFMVAGEGKAKRLKEVLTPPLAGESILPAGQVIPTNGDLLWLLDAAAAGNL